MRSSPHLSDRNDGKRCPFGAIQMNGREQWVFLKLSLSVVGGWSSLARGMVLQGKGCYNKKTLPPQDEPDLRQLGWEKGGGGGRASELQKCHLFPSIHLNNSKGTFSIF